MGKPPCRQKWRCGLKKPLACPWRCCCACRPGMTATPCASAPTRSPSNVTNRCESGRGPASGTRTHGRSCGEREQRAQKRGRARRPPGRYGRLACGRQGRPCPISTEGETVDVFAFRQRLIADYERFSRSFSRIRADDIAQFLDAAYHAEQFWPAPLVQLNPHFVPGGTIEDLVDARLLHEECRTIFRTDKTPQDLGKAMRLHKHQEEAIRVAKQGDSYVLTTGTGSGKSLAYFIPIIDDVLRRRSQGDPCKGISAIVIYPMNALCNSQLEELHKFLTYGYGAGKEPVTYARYTGQESQDERQKIAENPPDILLTNYVMLELIMTRQDFPDPQVVAHAQGLRFLVLDELHTYRGRQGADVAMLVRRVRERLNLDLLCVGTSATMASEGTVADRNTAVATIATRLFGMQVRPTNIITETLERVTPDDVSMDGVTLAAALH